MNASVSHDPVADRLAAEDLEALAWLHEAERTHEQLIGLHQAGFPQSLSLLPEGHEAGRTMADSLALLENTGEELLAACNHDLAADYAGIYLTHRLRASPCASVWLDPDQLLMQAPTFAVREFYARHGMRIANWRHQPDDHLAHLLREGDRQEAARFVQTHLLTWLPRFCGQVEQRAHTRFYSSLAALTLACVQACADRLPKVAVRPADAAAIAAPAPAGCGSS